MATLIELQRRFLAPDTFVIGTLGPNEVLVTDGRGAASPSQQIEQKLRNLLPPEAKTSQHISDLRSRKVDDRSIALD